MEFRAYRITGDDSGRRIDRVVRRFLPELSLSSVYKLLRKGLIRVDGARVQPDFHVCEGSELKIATVVAERPAENEPQPSNAPPFIPDIILETKDLLFINKPRGLSVHGVGGLDTLIPSTENADRSLSFRTGPLHRLDRDTTGVLAFSRSLPGARWFSDAISGHRIDKYYLGIARGVLSSPADWNTAGDDGKNMITHALPLASSDVVGAAFTLVEYRIETGRKHQIRLQTSANGHPLAGDSRYGGSGGTSGGKISFPTYCLHAWRLVLPSDRLVGLPDALVAAPDPVFRETVLDLFGKETIDLIDAGLRDRRLP